MKCKQLLLLIVLTSCVTIYASDENNFIDAPRNVKPWIGIKVNNYMKEEVRKEINDGIVIKDIVHSSVKSAGLKEGDIIKKVDNIEILTIEDFNKILLSKKVGDSIKISFMRNHEVQEISINLDDKWGKAEEVLKDLGVKIKPIIKDDIFGVIITDVIKNSKSEKYGINKMDIILGINRNFFKNIDEFNDIASHVDLEKEAYFLVMRKDDQNNYITITKQIGEKKEILNSKSSADSKNEYEHEE